MLGTIGVFLMLSISSIFDIRKKSIPIQILVAAGIWAVICLTLSVTENGAEVLAGSLPGLLPGAVLLMLGFLTQQKVGYGDGILLIIMGLMEGVRMVLLTFCIGLFLQSILAVILVLFKKADKQTQTSKLLFVVLSARPFVRFDLDYDKQTNRQADKRTSRRGSELHLGSVFVFVVSSFSSFSSLITLYHTNHTIPTPVIL